MDGNGRFLEFLEWTLPSTFIMSSRLFHYLRYHFLYRIITTAPIFSSHGCSPECTWKIVPEYAVWLITVLTFHTQRVCGVKNEGLRGLLSSNSRWMGNPRSQWRFLMGNSPYHVVNPITISFTNHLGVILQYPKVEYTQCQKLLLGMVVYSCWHRVYHGNWYQIRNPLNEMCHSYPYIDYIYSIYFSYPFEYYSLLRIGSMVLVYMLTW
jgi:hypothetical protein